jgi:GNAT superfamily N-acetyltransferase
MSDPNPEVLVFRSAYWDDPAARAAFKSFLIDIHGLDLSEWERCGYWDERYVPYSLFDGSGRVAASACLYSMDAVLGGRRCVLGQLSAMGTRPELRRRGLARRLLERAMSDSAAEGHAGTFLFANDEAVPFYRRCGFVPVAEETPTLAVTSPPAPRPGIRRLDPTDAADRALVYRRASERAAVSNVLGAIAPKLVMFHFLHTLAEHTYHIADVDAVVAFGVRDGVLSLYDVIARKMPSLADIHPYLGIAPHREIVFHFAPDRLGVTPTGSRPLPGNNAHRDQRLRLPDGACVFPFTAHA